ncbi:MAG: exodeoxyribonuclease V subunit beta, partial [Xanthomonadales bacterium]|nr:exodeoxyribonuclease V subunit beta [Xanthomonadales bacterium]
RLIEASAGTGKTFTLATLYLRALLVQRRRVPEVLVVTFTEAATTELRLRLRARLSLAAGQLTAFARDATMLDDDAAADTESRLVCATLRLALAADNDVSDLNRHLSLCLLDLDQAPISTLHGFCQRALSDHAFASGHLLDPGELDGDDRLRLQEVCDALWREIAVTGGARAQAMSAMWNSPEEMAAALHPLLAQPAPLLPEPHGDTRTDDDAALQTAFETLVNAWQRDGAAAHAALQHALSDLKANIYSADKLNEAFAALAGLADLPRPPTSMHERFPLLGQAKIEQATKASAIRAGRVIRHRLFDAVDSFLAALETRSSRRAQIAIGLLHELRAQAAVQLAELKRRRRVRSFDDLIDDLDRALADGDRGKALAAAIRRAQPLALVDEFQDTDDRQWRILQRIYVEADHTVDAATLVLVGDPKQAIYRFRNGDIHTYLRAAAQMPTAWRLPRNFRSRPSLVAAVNDLFDARQRTSGDAFVDPRIVFQPVDAALPDERVLLREGAAPSAMALWSPPPAESGERRKRDLEQIALDATVADICDWLQAARRGEASVAQGEERRALRPGDMAVLVGTNPQATRVQKALADHGVAAVCAGQESLFAGDEAIELHRLLRALLREGDSRALRAALATDLVGLDAAAIAALNDENSEGSGSFDLALVADWRRCWHERGVLMLVERLLREAAPRWLSRHDGARRFTNMRHLAELLDEARRSLHDCADLLRWLERRMATADPRNEAEQPRLDTDADRVQIMTVHKSKGLEFGMVYLPFIALPSAGRSNRRLSLFRYHEANDEPRWRACIGRREAPEDAAAEFAASDEELAESLRLVYVALTRARWAVRAFWVPWTRASSYGLSHLFGAEGLPESAAGDCLDSVAAAHAGRISHRRLSGEESPIRLSPEAGHAARLSACPVRPRPRDDWRRHSFSALVRGANAVLERSAAAADEADAGLAINPQGEGDALADWPGNAGPAGPGFGNAVHALLESANFADWRDGDALHAPITAERALLAALQREGIDPERIDNSASARQQALRLAEAGLLSPLPMLDGAALRLIDLPPAQCQPELEFELRLQAARGDQLLRLLHSHGHLQDVAHFGARAEYLHGLLHGFIDLVYRHGDTFYLLDYKTNRLPAYDGPALRAAMREHHYDLQYLLYALALHRWLRQRLGPGYDPARHFGGARYLFLRGRVAGTGPTPPERGLFVDRPPVELLDAMDRLFEGSGSGDST